MGEYTTKPAQFRLPAWAHEFIAEESSATGASKTDVVLEALQAYRRKRFEDLMAEGYIEMADEDLTEAKLWESTLMDGLEDEEW